MGILDLNTFVKADNSRVILHVSIHQCKGFPLALKIYDVTIHVYSQLYLNMFFLQ